MRFAIPSIEFSTCRIERLTPPHAEQLGENSIQFWNDSMPYYMPLYIRDSAFMTLLEEMLTHAHDNRLISMTLAERLQTIGSTIIADQIDSVSISGEPAPDESDPTRCTAMYAAFRCIHDKGHDSDHAFAIVDGE